MSSVAEPADARIRAMRWSPSRARGIRRAVSRGGGAALVAVLIVWWLALRPVSLGGQVSYVMIRGTSMLPTYETGDLVIARAATDYAVGDVVAYRVPAGEIGAGHIVLHRIVGGDATNGFVVRGDNNATVDPWMPRRSDIVGRQWLWFAQAGRVIALLHQPTALGALAAAVVVAWFVLRSPARPDDRRRAGTRAVVASERQLPVSVLRRRSNSSSSISPRA